MTWRNIKQFRALTPLERRLFVQAIVLLPLMAVVLRVCGLKRSHRVLERLLPSRESKLGTLSFKHVALGIRRSLLVLRLARQYGVHEGNCLSRSLVLWSLLRRQGIESDLRIGTRTAGGRFEAHAWVEYDGHPLNEDQDVYERYAVFSEAIQPDAKVKAS
jgi:hypothetical protein